MKLFYIPTKSGTSPTAKISDFVKISNIHKRFLENLFSVNFNISPYQFRNNADGENSGFRESYRFSKNYFRR